jgi:hypothetical protein
VAWEAVDRDRAIAVVEQAVTKCPLDRSSPSEDDPGMTSDRDSVPPAVRLGAEVVGVVLLALLAALVLMVLGVAVRGLSQLVGTPLPYVHDDPNHATESPSAGSGSAS